MTNEKQATLTELREQACEIGYRVIENYPDPLEGGPYLYVLHRIDDDALPNTATHSAGSLTDLRELIDGIGKRIANEAKSPVAP
jgi:hypothetical protein